jgi:hypothetical protein
MSNNTYSDKEERDALRDGAWALYYCRELLANRTSKPEPDDGAARRAAMKANADTLMEMADCYLIPRNVERSGA